MSWPLEKKIETIATLMYGARNVEYTLEAREQLKKINELGFGESGSMYCQDPEVSL